MDQTIPAIRVQDLTIQIGGHVVIDSISFEVPANKTTAIIGPNGAGKTVLLKSILRLLPVTSGTIEIFGTNNKEYGQITKTLSYIPQRLAFDGSFPLTVRGLFSLKSKRPLGMSHEEEKRMESLLERVGMGHLANAKVSTLSGGQLQRILIGYSLMDQPQLLILDEPAAGIDVQGQQTVYSLLEKIQQEENLTLLLVSHELDIVARYAKQVLCLNKKLFCSGVPHEVLSGDMFAQMYGTPIAHQVHNKHHHHYD